MGSRTCQRGLFLCHNIMGFLYLLSKRCSADVAVDLYHLVAFRLVKHYVFLRTFTPWLSSGEFWHHQREIFFWYPLNCFGRLCDSRPVSLSYRGNGPTVLRTNLSGLLDQKLINSASYYQGFCNFSSVLEG